jgi:hypothetical protein
VSRPDKTLAKVLGGMSDENIPFDDLCRMLTHLGFAGRIRGSHHVYFRKGTFSPTDEWQKTTRSDRSERL